MDSDNLVVSFENSLGNEVAEFTGEIATLIQVELQDYSRLFYRMYAVWEKVCAEVFDNKLHTTLGQLKMFRLK